MRRLRLDDERLGLCPWRRASRSSLESDAQTLLGKSMLVPSIILNLSMRFKQFKEMVPLFGPPSVPA